MEDSDLSDLLLRARRAQDRVDTSRQELYFETRMRPVLRVTRQRPGTLGRFQEWVRATALLAAATGVVAFFAISGWEEVETEDTLNAWWTNSSAAWNLQFFTEPQL